jgi:hypothetical protein
MQNLGSIHKVMIESVKDTAHISNDKHINEDNEELFIVKGGPTWRLGGGPGPPKPQNFPLKKKFPKKKKKKLKFYPLIF